MSLKKLKSSNREKGASSVCSICGEAQGTGRGASATKGLVWPVPGYLSLRLGEDTVLSALLRALL